MSSRMTYLYEPLGGHPRRTWRDSLRSPTRWTAILAIVALSLTSIAILTLWSNQWPWKPTSLAPKIFPPAEHTSLPLSPPASTSKSIPSGPPERYPPSLPTTALVGHTTYHPFVAPSALQAIADPRILPIRAQQSLSSACLDHWVSTGSWGDPCTRSMMAESKIDLVYVWVNGSDVLHQRAREVLLKKTNYRTKDARFREHDELRYSLRSVREATKTWRNSTWHVVTADVVDPGQDGVHRQRLGLVPQWLDIECSYHGSEEPQQPPIRLQHDTQLFRLTSTPGKEPNPQGATEWLEKILPSFNSHAVESQLPQLDPELVSDHIVALNDDQFMLLPVPPSAFHTTLYGPVFRVDPNLLVAGDASGSADGGGEWRSLGWSNHLLSERFGSRKRPYMQHNARSMSLPLMHEAALMFGQYFANTPLSQFRGSHKVKDEFEVNTIFLTTHFVVERHREALLYSWVVLKWDGNRKAMWKDLGGKDRETEIRFDKVAERTTPEDVELNLLMAGIAPPKAVNDTQQGDTTYTWTSMDGYSPRFNKLVITTNIPRSCIDVAGSSWELFRHLVAKDPACGDQIISALIHKYKSGLGAFLPAPSSIPDSPDDPVTLPLILPTKPPKLPANPRQFAVRLLQRYAHVLGDSPTEFIALRGAGDAKVMLNNVNLKPATSLLCLNDDLGSSDATLKATDKVLKDWFDKRWPERLRCEV